MAKQRIINTKFWSDSYIVNLNPLDRYLFLYFLTNEHTNICGIYELPLVTMANETGIEKEMLLKMIKRLKGKVYYFNGWVYLKNFAKHQSNNESVKKGIETAISLIPKEIMEKVQGVDSLSQPPTEPGVFESEFESKLEFKNTVAQRATPSLRAKRVKETRNSSEPISLFKEIKILEDSSERYKNIIALYLENRKPDLRTWGQLKEAIDRHSKAAAKLKSFSDDQIVKGFGQAKKQTTEWTLETVLKNLTK